MKEEELNDIVCQSSSDYEILDNAYDYIEKLEKENKQLKDNWDKLKKHLTDRYNNGTESISYRDVFIEIKEMMKEIEQGSDSNE